MVREKKPLEGRKRDKVLRVAKESKARSHKQVFEALSRKNLNDQLGINSRQNLNSKIKNDEELEALLLEAYAQNAISDSKLGAEKLIDIAKTDYSELDYDGRRLVVESSKALVSRGDRFVERKMDIGKLRKEISELNAKNKDLQTQLDKITDDGGDNLLGRHVMYYYVLDNEDNYWASLNNHQRYIEDLMGDMLKKDIEEEEKRKNGIQTT